MERGKPFAVDQQVEVRADGRVGKVLNMWKANNHVRNGFSGYKYLVEFPKGNKEYFTTTGLKAV